MAEAGEGALEDLAVAPMERLGLVVGAGARQQTNGTEGDHQSHADEQRGETPQQSHTCLPFTLAIGHVEGSLEAVARHLSTLGRLRRARRPTVPER